MDAFNRVDLTNLSFELTFYASFPKMIAQNLKFDRINLYINKEYKFETTIFFTAIHDDWYGGIERW